MRTSSKNTIYLSDYFTVPMPTHASSHQDYLRKIKNRKILWALLPYCIQAVGLLLVLTMAVVGISVFALSFGG